MTLSVIRDKVQVVQTDSENSIDSRCVVPEILLIPRLLRLSLSRLETDKLLIMQAPRQ